MATCERCGQAMVMAHCADCDAYGYWYGRDETGECTPVVCQTCAGLGKVERCVNRDCPSQPWYPLDARSAGILRGVKR